MVREYFRKHIPCELLGIFNVCRGDFLGTLALARAPRAQAKKIENRNLGFSQGTYQTTAQCTI